MQELITLHSAFSFQMKDRPTAVTRNALDITANTTIFHFVKIISDTFFLRPPYAESEAATA